MMAGCVITIQQCHRDYVPDCLMGALFVVVLRPISIFFCASARDVPFNMGLPRATRFGVVGGRIDQEHLASTSDRYTPVTLHLVNQLALLDRP